MAAGAAQGHRGGPVVGELTGPAIAADRLAAGYGGRRVWSDATFSIPAGSFTAILGPNGSGKSTLIRMILGLLAPAAGRLEVWKEAPRRGNPLIGYIPQRSAFDPELSIRGRDFVGLGVDGHRWGVRVTRRRVAAAAAQASIEAVGAAAYADRPLGRLSGGEQQRLLLAQALVGEPRLLLMDEPLSYLDVRHQGTVVQLIGEIARRRNLTVLLIAHDVNPLLRHIDHVLYVAAGKVAMGAPAEIITSRRLSEIYSAPVEVISDSRGRRFVVGLEEEASHPHG
ncbi:MAG: metal ABC transporter ATP-binding protein [Candidatus Dormibacteraceae bacterium]